MTIRPATLTDIPTLCRLLCAVLDLHHEQRPDIFKPHTQKYTEAELAEILNNESTPVFVACDEKDTVLGYAFCQLTAHKDSHVLTDIKTLYIDDLCVDVTCQGKGVGTALYRHCVAFAKEQGCYNLTLNVWAKNKAALRFYEKCGLTPQKIGMETIL